VYQQLDPLHCVEQPPPVRVSPALQDTIAVVLFVRRVQLTTDTQVQLVPSQRSF
jgi:hypothetical protein